MKRLERKWAIAALAIFTTVATTIVLIHSFVLGYGLRADMTISRYVGLDFWSADVFLLANIAMAVVMIKFVYSVAREWGMSRLWLTVAILEAVALVMLSLCPVGLYDAVPEELGVVSRLHKFSSYSMFALMLVSSLGLVLKVKVRWFRVYTAVYFGCGILMALAAVLALPAFWGNTLLLESLYLLGYLVLLCLVPKRKGQKEPDVV